MKGNLGTYVMDTDVFIDHVMDRYLFSVNAFDSHVMYNIEIAPYVALLEVQSVQFHHLFYSKFNRLLDAVGMLSSEQKIKSHMDILDKPQLLCWIYYIQDHFL